MAAGRAYDWQHDSGSRRWLLEEPTSGNMTLNREGGCWKSLRLATTSGSRRWILEELTSGNMTLDREGSCWKSLRLATWLWIEKVAAERAYVWQHDSGSRRWLLEEPTSGNMTLDREGSCWKRLRLATTLDREGNCWKRLRLATTLDREGDCWKSLRLATWLWIEKVAAGRADVWQHDSGSRRWLLEETTSDNVTAPRHTNRREQC